MLEQGPRYKLCTCHHIHTFQWMEDCYRDWSFIEHRKHVRLKNTQFCYTDISVYNSYFKITY
jgi:hypothetical protein